jgi:putative endonuclease
VYQVYLISNPDGRRYMGLSEDVALRVTQHNASLSKWTSKYGPWTLGWTSRPMPLGDARRLENLLKRQKGGSGLVPLLVKYASSGS